MKRTTINTSPPNKTENHSTQVTRWNKEVKRCYLPPYAQPFSSMNHYPLSKSPFKPISNEMSQFLSGRSRPLGTSFSIGSMVFFDLHLPRLIFPPYGFLATGSPRLTAFSFLCHRQSSLFATRSFLPSPCSDFDTTDFCHLRRRSNLLICLIAIFGLNDDVRFCFNSVTSNFGSWYWLWGALPRTFFARRSHLSSREQKKKLCLFLSDTSIHSDRGTVSMPTNDLSTPGPLAKAQGRDHRVHQISKSSTDHV